MKRSVSRRLTVVMVGLLAVTGLSISSAQQARAATISVPFVCAFNAPSLAASYDLGITNYAVTMTAPEMSDAGSAISVTYDFPSVNTSLPFAITGAQVRAEPTIDIRKQSGSALFNATGTGATGSSTTISIGGSVSAPMPVTITVPTATGAGAPTTFVAGDKLEFVPALFKYTFVAADDANLVGAQVACTPQTSTAYGARTTIAGVVPASPISNCIAQTGDTTGGAGCATDQIVRLSVLQGQLTQRTYTNTTSTSGSTDGSGTTTPVLGTSNANSNATTINLGTVTSPLAPAPVNGTLNDITISDTRGGRYGWSLTATLTNFNGATGKSMARSTLTATPSCVTATNGTAWDYSAPSKTAIAGFDSSLVAPGQAAGSSAQSFAGTVGLCTKNTDENLTTGTTGGVYNVTSALTLTIPAFQSADRYTATMTITLA
jgi:hypothetical protein